MSNVKPFISKDEIHQQACEWVSKIDRGLSPSEKQSIHDWANTSEAHASTLFEVARLFDELTVLNELSGLFPLREKQTKQVRTVFSDRTRWGVAASFAFVFLASLGLIMSDDMNTPNSDIVAHTKIFAETQIGEQKPVTLSDGSVVHLNTNSRVEINYSGLQRKITLIKGEAHFDVAHNPSKPFVVVAGENTVTAVGTAFNVELLNDDHFELLVTEGKVLVKEGALNASSPGELLSPSHPINSEGLLVESGQKVVFDGSTAPGELLSLDQAQKDLAWQQGMLVFQGETLDKALIEVSRYTPIKFEVEDPNLKETRVAGYFKAGDIEGLLFALENSFNIQNTKLNETRIALSSRK